MAIIPEGNEDPPPAMVQFRSKATHRWTPIQRWMMTRPRTRSLP